MGERTNPISGRLVVGLALVALGALWTVDNLGLLEADRIVRWWPVVPIAVGLMKLTGFGMEKQVPFGAFLTIVGTLFMLGELNVVDFGFGIVWPLLFIFMGVQLTMRAMRGAGQDPVPGATEAGDYVNSFAVMGSVERRNDSQAFRGGELTAVMGGVQLDLDQAVPADGRAVIEVLAIWGGIEIRVPEDWRVEVEATPVMGGVESTARLAPGVEPVGTLVVRGFVLMGGVEVKNGPLKETRVGVVVRRSDLRRGDRRGGNAAEGTVVTKEVRVGLGGIEVRREIIPPATPPASPQPPVEPQ